MFVENAPVKLRSISARVILRIEERWSVWRSSRLHQYGSAVAVRTSDLLHLPGGPSATLRVRFLAVRVPLAITRSRALKWRPRRRRKRPPNNSHSATALSFSLDLKTAGPYVCLRFQNSPLTFGDGYAKKRR